MSAARMRAPMLAGALFLALAFASTVAASEPLRLSVGFATAGLPMGKPGAYIRLAENSARLFAQFSAENLNRPINILVDGRSMDKLVLREPIVGGWLVIWTEQLELEEARSLVTRLTNGTSTLTVDTVRD